MTRCWHLHPKVSGDRRPEITPRRKSHSMTNHPSRFRTHPWRALIFVGTLVLASAGRESTGDTVNLTVSNVLGNATTTPYVTVVLTQKSTNVVEFSVTPNVCPQYSGTGKNFGIAGFGFNTQLNLTPTDIAFNPPSSGLDWKLVNPGTCVEFGTFIWVLSSTSTRALNPLVFDVTFSAAVPGNFERKNALGREFAANVVNFTTSSGVSSQWVTNATTAVILPPPPPPPPPHSFDFLVISLVVLSLLILIGLMAFRYVRKKPSEVSP